MGKVEKEEVEKEEVLKELKVIDFIFINKLINYCKNFLDFGLLSLKT